MILCALAAGQMVFAEDAPPAWAYPVRPADFAFPPDDGVPRHVPGSDARYTAAQTRDFFFAPVWHPGEHPALPPVVATGRRPAVFACGFCHREDGSGGPENARLAGLPAAYIAQQMADFRTGARKTSVPGRNVDLMIALAQEVSAAEVEAAATYFSAIAPRGRIRVVEADTVPATFAPGFFLAAVPGGEREPIGRRLVEVPEDLEQFENRDPRARFIVYAPPGSLARGERLVVTGDAGRLPPCAGCHGPDLRGAGTVPPIAGGSPSYVMRQFHDFLSGARAGVAAPPMRAVVTAMSPDDRLAVAAYIASLDP